MCEREKAIFLWKLTNILGRVYTSLGGPRYTLDGPFSHLLRSYFVLNLQSASLEIPISPHAISPILFFFIAGWLTHSTWAIKLTQTASSGSFGNKLPGVSTCTTSPTHSLKFIHTVQRWGDTGRSQWRDPAVGIVADHPNLECKSRAQHHQHPSVSLHYLEMQGLLKERKEEKKYMCLIHTSWS